MDQQFDPKAAEAFLRRILAAGPPAPAAPAPTESPPATAPTHRPGPPRIFSWRIDRTTGQQMTDELAAFYAELEQSGSVIPVREPFHLAEAGHLVLIIPIAVPIEGSAA